MGYEQKIYAEENCVVVLQTLGREITHGYWRSHKAKCKNVTSLYLMTGKDYNEID